MPLPDYVRQYEHCSLPEYAARIRRAGADSDGGTVEEVAVAYLYQVVTRTYRPVSGQAGMYEQLGAVSPPADRLPAVANSHLVHSGGDNRLGRHYNRLQNVALYVGGSAQGGRPAGWKAQTPCRTLATTSCCARRPRQAVSAAELQQGQRLSAHGQRQ